MKDDKQFTPEQTEISLEGTPSVALMWMHLTWFSFWPVALIIWFVMRNKHQQASTHGKHIINAAITYQIWCIAIAPIVCFVYFSFVDVPIASVIMFFSLMCFGCIFNFIFFYPAILSALAARKGKCIPYWYAIRFFQNTRFKES